MLVSTNITQQNLKENISFSEFMNRKRLDHCFICLENDSAPEIMSLCCGGAAHWTCYNQWMSTNSSCPCCLKQILNPRSPSSISPPQSLSELSIISPVMVTIHRIAPRRQVPMLTSPHLTEIPGNTPVIQRSQFSGLVTSIWINSKNMKTICFIICVSSIIGLVMYGIFMVLCEDIYDTGKCEIRLTYSNITALLLHLLATCLTVYTARIYFQNELS
jgi:hypothetical protein